MALVEHLSQGEQIRLIFCAKKDKQLYNQPLFLTKISAEFVSLSFNKAESFEEKQFGH